MHIKLRQLSHALALFRHGSFRRAAEAEHISQPALSRSIQSLEKSLGVQLFDRQTAEIGPTAFGEALLRRAETILTEAAELEREMLLLQGLDTGQLAVGMCLFAAELSGNQALADLLAAHPRLKIKVRQRYWGELEKLVLMREIDLGFGEIGHLMDTPDLRVEPVGRHELLFFTRPGHPILDKTSVSPADLDAYPMASTPVRASQATLMPRNLRVEPFTDYSVSPIQLEDLRAMRAVVAGTDALGFATPVQLEPLMRSGEIAVLPFRAPWLRLDYGFFYPASRSLSPAAEAFMVEVRRIEREAAERNRRMVDEIFAGVRVVAEPTA